MCNAPTVSHIGTANPRTKAKSQKAIKPMTRNKANPNATMIKNINFVSNLRGKVNINSFKKK
jgi:hypothetical protein